MCFMFQKNHAKRGFFFSIFLSCAIFKSGSFFGDGFMATKSDVITFFKEIGTKEKPVRHFVWMWQLFLIVLMFCFTAMFVYSQWDLVAKDTVMTFLFIVIFLLYFLVICFLSFGLLQYVKYRNC